MKTKKRLSYHEEREMRECEERQKERRNRRHNRIKNKWESLEATQERD
jgi:hypothetical protein